MGGNTVNPYCDSASCELTLIDWSIPATIGVQRFQQTGAYEELMVSKVKKYLEDVPRK